jgi:hypothetical protein
MMSTTPNCPHSEHAPIITMHAIVNGDKAMMLAILARGLV